MSPPIYTPDGNEVTKIVLPDGSTASEVVAPDGSVVFDAGPEIPDSEANQKLVHRWLMDEGAGTTAADSIGNADGDINGPTWLDDSGWVGGHALDGDGADDYVETTTWENFGSQMDTDFAIAFTFQDTSIGASTILSCEASVGGSNTYLRIDMGFEGPNGSFRAWINDDNVNNFAVHTDDTFDDGNRHRVVWNKTGNSEMDQEWWVDGVNVNVTASRAATISDVSDFAEAVALFARSASSSFDRNTTATIDDFCVFDDSLTSGEIGSYDSPWN